VAAVVAVGAMVVVAAVVVVASLCLPRVREWDVEALAEEIEEEIRRGAR